MREVLIAIVLFSAIVTGFSTFIVGAGNEYGLVPEDLTGLSQQTQVAGNVSQIQNSLNQTGGQVTLGTLDLISESLFGTLRLVLFIPIALNNIVGGLASALYLPPWFTIMLGSIVAIIIVFMFISAIQRWRT